MKISTDKKCYRHRSEMKVCWGCESICWNKITFGNIYMYCVQIKVRKSMYELKIPIPAWDYSVHELSIIFTQDVNDSSGQRELLMNYGQLRNLFHFYRSTACCALSFFLFKTYLAQGEHFNFLWRTIYQSKWHTIEAQYDSCLSSYTALGNFSWMSSDLTTNEQRDSCGEGTEGRGKWRGRKFSTGIRLTLISEMRLIRDTAGHDGPKRKGKVSRVAMIRNTI